MSTTEQACAAARRLARSAAQQATGVQACPYPAVGTSTQQAARRAWVRTYLHWRPPAPGQVSYDPEPAPPPSPDGQTQLPEPGRP